MDIQEPGSMVVEELSIGTTPPGVITGTVAKAVAPAILTSGSHPAGLVSGTFWQIPDTTTWILAGVEMAPSSESAVAPVKPKSITALNVGVSRENSGML